MKEHKLCVFKEAEVYIHAHLEEALQVQDIARAIHVSESSLQRCFRVCADTSVHEYMLRLKLEHAKQRLKKGESVGEAAKAVGFANRNYFSYCFKKEFGINPSQVKEKTP